MLVDTKIEQLLAEADAAIAEAIRLRKFYRRRMKPTNELRQRHLTGALEELLRVSGQLRSVMGRLPYIIIPVALEDRLRDTSSSLQAERRKLRKMLG